MMETNPAVNGPASTHAPANGNGNGHGYLTAQVPYEDPETYLAFTEANLANTRDGWFQQGYRAGYQDGFAEGLKQGSVGPAAASPIAANARANGAIGGEANGKVKTDHREQRLRGFPCAACGCASYNDEKVCPHCATPKDLSTAHPEHDPEHAAAHD